jgi:hydrogenase expression/formation protein HypC
MKITAIDGFLCTCEARGIEREVSLFMLQDEDFRVDEFVVVHVGYAIQKITPADARTAWDMYDLMLAGDPGEEASRA